MTSRFSPLVDRIASDGADGWAVHIQALAAEERGEDVIVLSVGDPDFPTPEPIIDAAVDALRAGDTHYASIPGRHQLRAAIAEDMSMRTGLNLEADNVLVTAGTQGALIGASMCLLGPGDDVVALEPMYLTYEATLCVGGASLITVAQSAASGFRPDIPAIEAAITPATRAIAITTPNNPTGVIMTRDELEAIAAIAIEHDLWVISDEVYADLAFEGEHVSIASLPGMAERTIIVTSLSKSHAMTGWRIGWAVGPADLITHMDTLQSNVNYGVPGFIQAAAHVALVTDRDASNAMRDAYRRRRDIAASILAECPDIDVLVPAAGMYVMINVERVTHSVRGFTEELYVQKRVSVIDASAFGPAANGWVRVSFTISDERLAEGCRRIVEFVNESK